MRNKIFFYLFLCVILFVILLNLRYPVSQYLRYNNISSGDNDFSKILAAYPYSRWAIVEYIRKSTPLTSKFLVFRQSDFVAFAQRVFIIKTDPRLIEFYNSNSIDSAFEQLVDLGIDYIYVPATPQPTIYNSHLDTIISDPRFTRLEYEKAGWRLFKLHSVPIEYDTFPLWGDDLFELQKWCLLTGEKLKVPVPKYQRKNFWSIRSLFENLKSKVYFLFEEKISSIKLLLINLKLKVYSYSPEPISTISRCSDNINQIYIVPESRGGISRLLYSGTGSLKTSPQSTSASIYTILPSKCYRFGAKVKGKGRSDVYFVEYNSLGEVIKSSMMWTGYLFDSTFTQINGVVITSDQAVECRLVFLFPDQEKVILKEISLDLITYSTTLKLADDDTSAIPDMNQINESGSYREPVFM